MSWYRRMEGRTHALKLAPWCTPAVSCAQWLCIWKEQTHLHENSWTKAVHIFKCWLNLRFEHWFPSRLFLCETFFLQFIKTKIKIGGGGGQRGSPSAAFFGNRHFWSYSYGTLDISFCYITKTRCSGRHDIQILDATQPSFIKYTVQ